MATLGAPHGLSGDIRLRLHTDDPAGRLVVGAVFATDPATAGPLEVVAVAARGGTVHARFAGHADRTAAEALKGVVLLADPEPEDDAWYPHELIGLAAVRPDGTPLGAIEGVRHLPAHDMLVLAEPGGARTLVPFVEQIVPEVDAGAGRVVIDAPHGLLAVDQADDLHE